MLGHRARLIFTVGEQGASDALQPLFVETRSDALEYVEVSMQFGSSVFVVLMKQDWHLRRQLLNWGGTQTLLVAMGLGLSLGPLAHAQAATLTVAPGAAEISADGVCALREALINANNDAATYPDCPAGSGADTIELAANSTYTLTDAPAECMADGPNGLPSVTTAITLNGNGATIERSAVDGTPTFRLLHVAATGDLTVQNLTIRRGTTPAALCASDKPA